MQLLDREKLECHARFFFSTGRHSPHCYRPVVGSRTRTAVLRPLRLFGRLGRFACLVCLVRLVHPMLGPNVAVPIGRQKLIIVSLSPPTQGVCIWKQASPLLNPCGNGRTSSGSRAVVVMVVVVMVVVVVAVMVMVVMVVVMVRKAVGADVRRVVRFSIPTVFPAEQVR